MPSTRSKKNNKNNKSKKNFQQGGGGGFLGKLFRKKTTSPNTNKKVPNPPTPPTARTNTTTNPNSSSVPSKNISTANTNNNPVPKEIQIKIKEQNYKKSPAVSEEELEYFKRAEAINLNERDAAFRKKLKYAGIRNKSNHVLSTNISTANTNNNPVPKEIQIKIKELIATKISDLIKTLKEKEIKIIIKIPAGKYIVPALQDCIGKFMFLYGESKNEYRLMYHYDKIKKDIIEKAQFIYEILDNKYKNQIIPDNFNLIDFINICLKDNLSDYRKMFLKGLKDIIESLILNNYPNLEIKIGVDFVEGLIH